MPSKKRGAALLFTLTFLLFSLNCSGARIEAGSGSACASPAEASGFNGGDGSRGDPYLICTYGQLAMMDDTAAALMANYQLGANINANPSWTEGAMGCTPTME